MHEEQGRCYIHDQTASQHIYSVWETTQLMMYKAQGSDLVLTQTSKCTVDREYILQVKSISVLQWIDLNSSTASQKFKYHSIFMSYSNA